MTTTRMLRDDERKADQLEGNIRRSLHRAIDGLGLDQQVALLMVAREMTGPGSMAALVLDAGVRPPLRRLGVA